MSSKVTTYLSPVQGDTLVLDQRFILQNSMQVPGYVVDEDYEQIGSKLHWKAASVTDSVRIVYSVLLFKVNYKNKSTDKIQVSYTQNPFKYTPSGGSALVDYGTLNTTGNVSRGIGFGNAQDVVVNSNLNLRLSGELAGGVEVLAVISDENNPIQPDGNTQQIQDFDQVYITLTKDSSKLTVGDFLMQHSDESYFINFYKRSRGIQVQNKTALGSKWSLKTQGEAALSRGRFSRNQIAGIEGNSGPYRLSGQNGENFIIIIAGTENVFLDGKLLTRGEDNDYVINYNTGEVTFTPKVLITRYSRIVTEFQYSDRNYGRSVVHAGVSLSNENLSVYTNFFNEMDLKSQPFQQSVDGFDSIRNLSAQQILTDAGDSLAFFSNVREEQVFNTDRIMYVRDTVLGAPIFVYASDPTLYEIFYQVTFTNVGVGRGDYRQASTGANGRVFEYQGANMGDYAPLEVLIAPESFNAFNIGLVRETDGKKLGIEYAVSSRDKNTFSSRDDSDNSGFGLKLFRESKKRLRDSSAWLFSTRVDYELVSTEFSSVERYRGVEFDRQWNKVLENPNSFALQLPAYEHIANATVGLKNESNEGFQNQTSYFGRPNSFEGFSNKTDMFWSVWKWDFSSEIEVLSSTTQLSDTQSIGNDFLGVRADLRRTFKKLSIGAGYEGQRSAFSLDTLLAQSFAFQQYKVTLGNGDSNKLRYNLYMSQRSDQLPKNNGFAGATVGRDIGIEGGYTFQKFQRVEFSTIYRELDILDSALSNKGRESTLQSRVELNLKLLKNFVTTRSFYQVGTGQEQRREFQYLQVAAGNGTYIWNDYDSNGLQTLNEFEQASILDKQRADYIKIFTPVPGFFTTNTNSLSQTIQLNPGVFFRGRKKKAFLARINTISSLLLDTKVLPSDILSLLNPFQSNLSDTSLISSSRNFRNTLFFNRGNPKYSLDYTFRSNASKVLLTNGFDSRATDEHIGNIRINLGRLFTLDTRLASGQKEYNSEFFVDNSYFYTFYEIEPKIQFTFKNQYRFELLTKYFDAKNRPELGGESSENIEIGGEFKYTKAGKGTLDAGVSYINIDYEGSTSSTLGYELLRGLQDGNNATWKLGYQRTLPNNIQVVISYDGRKSEDSDVIHLGRLVARYLF